MVPFLYHREYGLTWEQKNKTIPYLNESGKHGENQSRIAAFGKGFVQSAVRCPGNCDILCDGPYTVWAVLPYDDCVASALPGVRHDSGIDAGFDGTFAGSMETPAIGIWMDLSCRIICSQSLYTGQKTEDIDFSACDTPFGSYFIVPASHQNRLPHRTEMAAIGPAVLPDAQRTVTAASEAYMRNVWKKLRNKGKSDTLKQSV